MIGIGWPTPTGQILEVNHALCDMLGCTAEELLRGSRSGRSSTPTTCRGCGTGPRSCSPGERNHLRVEKAYYRPDGSEIWTDLVLSLIRDPDGSPATSSR